MRLFLRDILAQKRHRGDLDAELFRRVACYEFAAGLNATAEGAASAMRRWVENRPAWVSDAQHAGRVAVLAAIERATDRDSRAADQPGKCCTVGRPATRTRKGSSDHLASLGCVDDDCGEASRRSPTFTIGIGTEVSSYSDPSP